MRIIAHLFSKTNGDHLCGASIAAETRAMGHADEFVFYGRLNDLKRLGEDLSQSLAVGAVGNDHVFPIDKAIGTGRIGRAGERHREGGIPYVLGVHGFAFLPGVFAPVGR